MTGVMAVTAFFYDPPTAIFINARHFFGGTAQPAYGVQKAVCLPTKEKVRKTGNEIPSSFIKLLEESGVRFI